ncbi:MAG: hypothetical protein GXY08_02215 [Ruminococcus sp.]|nr:hypothetical protein [Ruminococcus sp.]
MKNKIICLLSASAMAVTLASCSSSKSSSSAPASRSASGSENIDASSYENVFNIYMTAFYTDKNAEKVMEYSVPKAVIDKLKADNRYDEAKAGYETKISSQFSAYGDAPDYKGIISSADMSPDNYVAAASYLNDYYQTGYTDIKVTSGYEVKYSIDYKNSDGNTSNSECSACIVGIEGDGFRVIDGMNGDLLAKLYYSTTY